MIDYSIIIFYLIPLFKSKYIRHFNSITNYRNKKQFLSNVKKRVNNNVSNLFLLVRSCVFEIILSWNTKHEFY